jgi:DNA ligase-1
VKAFKQAFKQEAKAAKMEGVGIGALEAATLHSGFDIAKFTEALKWSRGAAAPYAVLADTFDTIAAESKRLTIVGTLTKTFRAIIELSPEDMLPAVYLCISRVCLKCAV